MSPLVHWEHRMYCGGGGTPRIPPSPTVILYL